MFGMSLTVYVFALWLHSGSFAASNGGSSSGGGCPLIRYGTLRAMRCSAYVLPFFLFGAALSLNGGGTSFSFFGGLFGTAFPSSGRAVTSTSSKWSQGLGFIPGAFADGLFIFAEGKASSFHLASGCPSPVGSVFLFPAPGPYRCIVHSPTFGRAGIPSNGIGFILRPEKTSAVVSRGASFVLVPPLRWRGWRARGGAAVATTWHRGLSGRGFSHSLLSFGL